MCEACSDACPKEVWQSERADSNEQTDISPLEIETVPTDKQSACQAVTTALSSLI